VLARPGQSRATMHELLTRVVAFTPGARLATVTVDADPSASVAVSLDQGGGPIYVDPYSARVLGSGSARVQAFFRSVENWHRWLGFTGDGRKAARAITDASNVAFLALALTGVFLWWPRKWLSQHLKAILCVQADHHGTRTRVQLAQRHRVLVRADFDRAHGDGRDHVVHVGEQSAVPRHWQPCGRCAHPRRRARQLSRRWAARSFRHRASDSRRR